MCAWRDRWRFPPRARLGIYLLHFYAVRSHCVYHYIYYRYRENVCLARSLAISAASSSGDLPPPVLPVRGWMEMMVSMRYFVSELSNATAALRCRPKTYSKRTHSIVREHILWYFVSELSNATAALRCRPKTCVCVCVCVCVCQCLYLCPYLCLCLCLYLYLCLCTYICTLCMCVCVCSGRSWSMYTFRKRTHSIVREHIL